MDNRSNPVSSLKVITSSIQALEQERVLFSDVFSGKFSTALSIWTTSRSLVVTRRFTHNSNFARAKKKSRERGWPVVVRDSGGGVTPQGDGILNVTAKETSTNQLTAVEVNHHMVLAILK